MKVNYDELNSAIKKLLFSYKCENKSGLDENNQLVFNIKFDAKAYGINLDKLDSYIYINIANNGEIIYKVDFEIPIDNSKTCINTFDLLNEANKDALFMKYTIFKFDEERNFLYITNTKNLVLDSLTLINCLRSCFDEILDKEDTFQKFFKFGENF